MIQPTVVDVKKAAKENSFFRKVLYTASKVQVVVMSLLPGEEIGSEVHDGDQLLYAAKGEGVAVLDGSRESFEKGMMFCVPAGARHNVINTGEEPLKLFTIYAPPQQRDASQLHHVSVDGLAEWIAWWDAQEASA